MANSGREHEDSGQLVNELERLRAEARRVRRHCDEAVESLREGWLSLGRSGKLDKGLSERGLSGRKDKRKRATRISKASSQHLAKD